jgi:deoxyadenosine/deoxycytidine kinase/nucleoside 2-deoxyribosyltransferase
MRGERLPRACFAASSHESAGPALAGAVSALLEELGYEFSFPPASTNSGGVIDPVARRRAFQERLEAVEDCDTFIFILNGDAPNAAACVEAGIAFGRGKRCIGLLSDPEHSPIDREPMVEGVMRYEVAADLGELRALLSQGRAVVDIRDPDNVTIDLRVIEQSYVAVSGPLGVGKSSLIELLAGSGRWTVLREPVMGNPYLSEVYANLPDLAFRNQAFYLGQRARLHNIARRKSGPLLQERCISEDGEVFTPVLREHGAYDDNDLDTLMTLYRELAAQVPRPDVLLYLHAPFEVTLERIKRRDRVGEGLLDVDFLRRIYDRYEDWAANQTRVPLLRLNTAESDYVNRPEDAAAMLRHVESLLTDALVLS